MPAFDRISSIILFLLIMTVIGLPSAEGQNDPVTVFAVVTKVPKDRRQVTAQVVEGGAVSQATLIATDNILDNLIWQKLEICHSLRAEVWKTGEGYRVAQLKVVDAGMLPMPLQGIAGDCLLKKALEYQQME